MENKRLVSITSIKLKGFLKFFALSYKAMHIVLQMKNTKQLDFKKQGLGKMHYTMTLWNSREDMNDFYRNGAHQEAMKASGNIAEEIYTYTYEGDKLPDWKTAKELLKSNGKVLKF